MTQGTKLFQDALAGLDGLDEERFAAPSLLPGWNRKQLIAHVAANAEAISNLIHWAATGIETPMYRTPQVRADGIAKGLTLSGQELARWTRESADGLAEAMDRLSGKQWRHEVVTAQGRTVRTTETPWMRAREVCVHVVDLGTGVSFADLPDDFNAALTADILAKRGMAEIPGALAEAPQPEVTAWLAGRPHTLTYAPDLGPWL
ncbi:maleylpyruvate isomerase family mycothiol-dependent enzyme [Actinospica sp. MGRD01-02]|uniref:Maleylpyruvate isomerase family mycothiol-dependent enzyme n=1 Tax=Actinospica acidithermotolerans TaxID=2828514 RepID=A0A941EEG7_9ACTN|nr:maleylpyruvate isomerase family mycothiol-dependent enzyme [Actinospica acidithermotolerans]